MTKKNSKKSEPKKAEHKAPKKSSRKVLLFSALGTGVGALFAVGALGYYVSTLPEEIFVNKTFVEGFYEENPEVQGTFTEFKALEAATQTWMNARLLEPLELSTESRGNASVTLTALGVSADWTALEQDLKNYMSEASLLKKTSTYLFGQTVEVEPVIDETVLNQTLAETGIEQGNKNAVFIWKDGAVAIESSILGYGVDRESLLVSLSFSTKVPMLPDTLSLTIKTSEPEISDADLERILPHAQELAPKTVILQDEFGNTWNFAVSEHIALLVPTEAAWTLDEAGFITYLETTLVPDVEEDPTGVVITENTDGSYAFEGSARFGKELDKLALREQVIAKLLEEPTPVGSEGEETVTDPLETPLALPITTVEPSITIPDSLAAKGVTDLVGLGYSDFSGSPVNRIHNIETGIAQFNGVLIEQGAEFSFMGHMSPVDAANGFLPELVIKGDETIPEYGGGLCQISSTMFRAALYSGLPITARRNHSYAVSYYARPFGYGLDATVYDPAPDFKFVNDTEGALLVQAYTDGVSAYYVFYGTNDGRTVTMEGPYSYNYNTVPATTTFTDKLEPGVRELKEYSHTGFTTDWYRTVTYKVTEPGVDENGKALYVSPYAAEASGVRELFHSVYEARPAKYWEGQAGEEVVTEE